MRYAKLHIVLRLQAQGVACPRKQRLSLTDNPVLPAIEVDRYDARYGRLRRDQSGDWGGGGDLLVEERNADWRTPKRCKEGQRR